jgi:hypothetical protein
MNNDLCYCPRRSDNPRNLGPCRGKDLGCSMYWLERMGDPEVYSAQNIDNETLPCLLNCDRQSKSLTVTSGLYPNRLTFRYRRDICLALRKVAMICNETFRRQVFSEGIGKKNITCEQILIVNNITGICNDDYYPDSSLMGEKMINFLYTYAQENFAVVSIQIRDPFYTRILRDEEISLVTFLGDAGGLMGLFMGVSLISFFEVFYFFFNFIAIKVYKALALGPKSKELGLS